MKPTRASQPYRAGGGRAPSPVLDAMKQGGAGASPGAALMGARGAAGKRRGVQIPRTSGAGRNMRAQWPGQTQR